MERKGIELTVGLFVLAGIAAGAGLILKLGQAGTATRIGYQVVVQFPTASGIIKNAKVLMAGVEVGRVVEEPGFNEDRSRARVQIGLKSDVTVPKASKFTIKQSGLLADPYIEVVPLGDPAGEKIQPGAVVDGERTTGLDDITSKVEPVLGQMKQIGERLDSALSKIDKGILTPETQADVRSAIAKFESAIGRAGQTVERINQDYLTEGTRVQFHGAMSNLNSSLARMDRILAQAERGEGPLNTVLKDPKAAEDLKVLLYSLRKHGVLFYSEEDPDAEKEKAKAPERRVPDSRAKRR